MNGFDLPIGVQELRAYKARPLDGVWATPPFLHNGSVPNLFQLLSPAAERSPQFYVGTFEFDRNSLDSAPRNSPAASSSTPVSPATATAATNSATAAGRTA